MRQLLLKISQFVYNLARFGLFQLTADRAHHFIMILLPLFDHQPGLAKWLRRAISKNNPLTVGGVQLERPLILAAGFVKGHGFETESEALTAVYQGKNIIPGWRFIPALIGPVEFGSFTRQPRLGNSGRVMWRDPETRSTQNRVGLKNPGALAAATFLAKHKHELPPKFGINIAVSPGMADPDQEQIEVLEALEAFLDRDIYPTWFTLNLSCPNTEDDPGGNQTEVKTRQLCQAVFNRIQSTGVLIPLWVKIGPDLDRSQYHILMRVFQDVGVRAVVATNTLGQPTPNNPDLKAGVGGGSLLPHTLQTIDWLLEARPDAPDVDIIGCGGVLDGESYRHYRLRGIHVVEYWSALVYRGPLAAAIIESEVS